jgi:hypothetical protein
LEQFRAILKINSLGGAFKELKFMIEITVSLLLYSCEESNSHNFLFTIFSLDIGLALSYIIFLDYLLKTNG